MGWNLCADAQTQTGGLIVVLGFRDFRSRQGFHFLLSENAGIIPQSAPRRQRGSAKKTRGVQAHGKGPSCKETGKQRGKKAETYEREAPAANVAPRLRPRMRTSPALRAPFAELAHIARRETWICLSAFHGGQSTTSRRRPASVRASASKTALESRRAVTPAAARPKRQARPCGGLSRVPRAPCVMRRCIPCGTAERSNCPICRPYLGRNLDNCSAYRRYLRALPIWKQPPWPPSAHRWKRPALPTVGTFDRGRDSSRRGRDL